MRNIEAIENILNETLGVDIKNTNDYGDRALFFATNFLCDLEVEDNGKTLSLSQIVFPKELRGLGLSKELIKDLESFSKDSGYETLKVPAVISSRMAKTLKDLGYEREDYNYPNFDASLYDEFDGFYGSFFKRLNKENI